MITPMYPIADVEIRTQSQGVPARLSLARVWI